MSAPSDRVIIITSSGFDNCCATALLLGTYPAATVMITSDTGLARLLSVISGGRNWPGAVHICGIPVNGRDIDQLKRSLRSLHQHKVAVFWYGRRGNLDRYDTELQGFCKCIGHESSTHTDCIALHNTLEDGENTTRLRELAAASYAPESKWSQNVHEWVEFIDASRDRYFLYGDTTAIKTAISALAVQETLTAEQKEMVEKYRKGRAKTIVGNSTVTNSVRHYINQARKFAVPVLILGPSGVGKELVARAIHYGSQRTGPLVPINCSTLSVSEGIAGSLLFGHTKGAFSGAHGDREGIFSRARKGTLFLDEVTELSLPLQALFLRVLEDGEVTPLGGGAPVCTDLRIIAATNRDIGDLIARKFFREDLYYRLNQFVITIPSLQDRGEQGKKDDIDPIIKVVTAELKTEKLTLSLTEADRKELYDYEWPGNIRQLINVLKRTVYMKISIRAALDIEKTSHTPGLGSGDTHAGGPGLATLFQPRTRQDVRPWREVQLAYYRHVHELFGQNMTHTAKALGISTNTLRTILQTLQ